MEAEAIRRACEGVVRMKFNSKTGLPFIDPRTGEPYMEHEYSDTLMLALLRRNFPDSYREQKGDIHVTSNVQNFTVLSKEGLEQLQAWRQEALQR